MKFSLPILLVAAICFLLSCDKDTFETKPTIRIKSISSAEVRSKDRLNLTIEYTDKEGDLNGSIFFLMHTLNQSAVGEPWEWTPINYKIPPFPGSSKGEISATFVINGETNNYEAPLPVFLSPYLYENDTISFKICVKDAAENVSDTIETTQIICIR